MLQDVRDYDRVKLAIERQEMEVIPSEVTFALLDGEQPIKVWREHRGLTQQQLATAAGISVPYLSQIENRRRTGTKEVLAVIARALNVTLDDIILSPTP
jgi:DNA-binding XRE family transcriptional regulator